MKYLYFFLIYINLLAQEIPSWIANHIEYSEQTISDIYSLRQEKININQSSLAELRTKLYFVPDSILKKAKYNPRYLSLDESIFLNQFWTHFSQLTTEHSLYFSSDLESYTNRKFSNPKEKLNVNSLFYFKNLRLMLSQKKRAFESYDKQPYLLISYVSGKFKAHIGDIALKNSNFLIYSSNYGNMFYPGQMRSNSSQHTDIRFQKSDISATSLRGSALSYKLKNLEFVIMNGSHNYYAPIKDNMFSSFNSILPIEKTKNISQENVNYSALNFTYKKSSVQISHLLLDYERVYRYENSYSSSEFKDSEFLALAYSYRDKALRLSSNFAYQFTNASAFDLSSNVNVEPYQLYMNLFHYDPNFFNPKSKGIMHGQSMARNSKGYALSVKRKFSNKFRIELGYLNKTKVSSESKNSFEEGVSKQFSDLVLTIKPIQINIYISGLNFDKLKNKISYTLNSKTKLSYIFRKRDKAYANQFQLFVIPFFFEIAFIETKSHWQIYEQGLKNEFLFSHFYSSSKRFLFKYSLKWDSYFFEFKYRYIWQEKEDFQQSDFTIKGRNRNTLSLGLKYFL